MASTPPSILWDQGEKSENTPFTWKISQQEQALHSTSLETIQKSLEAFHCHGLVVLNDVVSHGSLDHLRLQMKKDNEILLQKKNIHYNHGKSAQNLSQCPPLSPEYMHEDIWANKHACSIIEQIIGPKPQLAFFGANVAAPHGPGRQAVHSDAYFQHLDFAFGVEVNIFLDDVSEANGVTEVWLGSHQGSNFKDHVPNTRGWIQKDKLDARAGISPPIQPTIPKGSIMLRDLRTWHAGMPNKTSEPRIMLSFIYFPSWYRTPMRLTYPESIRPILSSWGQVDALGTANFVSGDIDHLNVQFSMNLTQNPEEGIGRDIKKRKRTGEKPAVSEKHYWTPPSTPATKRVDDTDYFGAKRQRITEDVGDGNGLVRSPRSLFASEAVKTGVLATPTP